MVSFPYVIDTTKSVGPLFQPLEVAIHQHFIPALTDQEPCSKLERNTDPYPGISERRVSALAALTEAFSAWI